MVVHLSMPLKRRQPALRPCLNTAISANGYWQSIACAFVNCAAAVAEV
jgi:hypothetical protein